MAFENDPEGRQLAIGYAGPDFDKPKIVRHDLLTEYFGEWTFDGFQELIAELSNQIPQQYRHTARVYLYDPGYDGSTSFRIDYEGPETAETVAARVRRCEEYIANRRAAEIADYNRLKAKFG